MDIAIVTTRMVGMDAISNFTMASAEALAKLGKATVYTFAYERPAVAGVEVRFLGGKNSHSMGTSLKALLDTPRLARELAGYDVLIMANPDVGSMPACRLAKKYNPKLKALWAFHGLTPVEYVAGLRDRWLMRVRRLAYARSMKRADLVRVDSHFVKSEVASWGVEPAKVAVMPLGIDLARMSGGDRRRIREKYGAGGDFLLLYVGRLVRFKGVDELIRVVHRLCGVRLLVVGGGPERGRLEALAGELHVGDRVKFGGVVPDEELPDYYAACDAWATASRHEGFCVPIIEAMAAGKPVIVPDVAASPETADGGGLVYNSKDPGGLTGQIARLMADRRLYGSVSGAARERALQFEMQGVLERYVAAIVRLSGGAKLPSKLP